MSFLIFQRTRYSHDTWSSYMIKVTLELLYLFSGWAYGYYVFGVLEIGWTFEVNSPYQQIDVLMSSINSSANPLLYYILMPKFRLIIMKTFFKPCLRKIASDQLPGQTVKKGAR